ncbi:MAG: 3-deoxy-manno-octulosonate cytidylyltransferase [Fimbriimonadaceae bacterium]|nr:3-deoxy-manno-octulosonate cytidylyltransferase [Fimbriimonadaceae bacterium]
MRTVAIIPARYAATRLPGKVLVDIAGKPMVQHVYERAAATPGVDEVLVATDDQRIADAVAAFGGQARMTSPEHTTGTDRLAEVARDLAADLVVNVQGDEPLIAPASIQIALEPFRHDPNVVMSTLRERLVDPGDLQDPNCVKVVVDTDDWALYFTRAPIPYIRNADAGASRWRHLGLYVYRRDFLLTYAALAPTPLQLAEGLEQLRALEHGYRIKCPLTPHPAIGVDTPADLERVRRMLAE